MTVVYSTGLKFNTVYVIESLPPGDLRSGQELYDAVLLPATHRLDGLHAEYHFVRTLEDLTSVLRMVADDCHRYNRGPLIHLETHGDSQGIGLSDGSHVPWVSITSMLAEINKACKVNLLVMAMMCRGWDLTTHLMPSDRAPAFMVIGPPDLIPAGPLEAATKRFYSSLVTAWDLNSALESMNVGVPFEAWNIRPSTAEILFCRVFRYYVQDLEFGPTHQDRENRLVADIARANGLTVDQTAMVRASLREWRTDHAWWYDHLRRSFLMLDLFPQNEARFGLSYAKCVGTVA